MERKLNRIELAEAPTKDRARLRLVFGEVHGPIWAAREDIAHWARMFLSMGHSFANAGAPIPPMAELKDAPEAIHCDAIGVMNRANDTSVLLMRFGTTELAVTVSTSAIAQALVLLSTAAQGGLPPSPRTVQ